MLVRIAEEECLSTKSVSLCKTDIRLPHSLHLDLNLQPAFFSLPRLELGRVQTRRPFVIRAFFPPFFCRLQRSF